MIEREEATRHILEAKERHGLTFRGIAEAVGRHPVWTTAALLGQQSMSPEEASAVSGLLQLDDEVSRALQQFPSKGSPDAVPVDPLLYRFHEINHVYGATIKALIHEMFGDGIMSAIDFEMDIQRLEDSRGDRVQITMNGKFLPYRKW
jgi:cyanate lyase